MVIAYLWFPSVKKNMRLSHAILLFWTMVFFAACGKEEEFTPPDSSYGLIYTQIFAPSCALSGCHLEADRKKDPVGQRPYLEGKDAYSQLFMGTPENGQAAAAGLKLIRPNDPGTSFLYQKIIYDSSAFQFGAKMPSGGLSLTADEILFVRQWITAGAPHDGHVADRSLIE
jgi:hypothetical protein